MLKAENDIEAKYKGAPCCPFGGFHQRKAIDTQRNALSPWWLLGFYLVERTSLLSCSKAFSSTPSSSVLVHAPMSTTSPPFRPFSFWSTINHLHTCHIPRFLSYSHPPAVCSALPPDLMLPQRRSMAHPYWRVMSLVVFERERRGGRGKRELTMATLSSLLPSTSFDSVCSRISITSNLRERISVAISQGFADSGIRKSIIRLLLVVYISRIHLVRLRSLNY